MNLPYIIDGDNVISQTNACFVYLGRKFNMLGANDAETSQCEQLLCEIMDLRNKMVGFAYNGGSDAASAHALIREVLGANSSIQKLELWLLRERAAGHSGTFFVGDKVSAPDFHIYEMLVQFSTMAAYYAFETPLLSSLPSLFYFKESFEALPQNSAYLASILAAMPFNNKMAAFHGTPSGDKWTLSTQNLPDANGEY